MFGADPLWNQSFPTMSSMGSLAGNYGGLNLQPIGTMSPENAYTYYGAAKDQFNMETQRMQAAAPIESARIGADAQRYGYDAQQNIARLQAQNAIDLLTKKQGYASGVLDRFFGKGGSGAGGLFGQLTGSGGGGPGITAGNIYSPTQVQALTNSQIAGNDARYSAELGDLMQSFGASGFSANSPLASAMRSQLLARNIGANANARLSTGLQTAQANAKHLLDTQNAQETQFSNRRRELAAMLSAFSPMFSI